MKRWIRIATALSAALAACVFQFSCASSLPEARKEESPGLSVRLPIAGGTTLNIESDPYLARPDLPLSLVDESRGRWLTLFEVNYSPAKPSAPSPAGGEEEPSR